MPLCLNLGFAIHTLVDPLLFGITMKPSTYKYATETRINPQESFFICKAKTMQYAWKSILLITSIQFRTENVMNQ